jgi:hypothetical protein
MAVNAKFTADFSSFHDAVKKADSSLNLWVANISKVEQSMKKLDNGFSGRTVIQEANQVAAAIEKIGGASKLTATEQAKVNATVTEALAKYKALGLEAPASLQKLAQATTEVQKQTSLAEKGASVLKSSFGQFTAANLAASAISSLTDKLSEFASKGSQLRGLESSFSNLTSSIKQDSGAMLSALQTGTRGLVADFDLFAGANKAMLLGLPVTSQSMGELAKTATTLGKAMGQDATKSLDDLITALGRSSPLILDNLGLTVKVGEANEAYAKKLGISVDAMTEAQKKMAFYEAAMEAARVKTKELGDQTLTLSERITTVWVEIENNVTRGASNMNVVLGNALDSWGNFFRFFKDSAAFKSWEEQAKKLEKPRPIALPFIDASALARDSKVFQEEMAAVDKAFEDGKRAAKDHAEAISELRNELSGKGAIKSAMDMVEALRGLPPVQRLTRAAQDDINAAMEKALAVYRAAGSEAPAAIRQIAAATFDLAKLSPKVAEGLSAEFANIGKQAKIAVPEAVALFDIVQNSLPKITVGLAGLSMGWEVAIGKTTKATKVWTDELDKLAQSMTNLSQTAGSGVVSALASMVNGINVGIKAVTSLKSGFADLTSGKGLSSILSGFTGIVSGIGGIVAAAQAAIAIGKALFGVFDRDKGRDLVEGFAKEFSGGFDEINKYMGMLGEEGVRMWAKLTQGGDVHSNPDAARKIIDEVRAAIERLKAEASSPITVSVHHVDTYDSQDRGGGGFDSENSFANGSGGFRNFGSGTPAMLHGWEAVVRPQDLAGAGGGGTVIVQLGEREIARVLMPAIADEVKRLRLGA